MIMINLVFFILVQRGRMSAIVHILEVLFSILDVDTGYLGAFRISSQYIKASAATMPQITLQQLLFLLHKIHRSLTITTSEAIRL